MIEATAGASAEGAVAATDGIPETRATGIRNAPALARPAPRRPAVLALLLAAVAGYLDAIGFVQLGQLYVSFMSGNSTQLGMAIATGAWTAAASAALVIAAFLAGSFAGSLLDAGARPAARVLAAELAVLLVALALALAGQSRAALFVVAMAMGMQNAAHQTVAGADIGRSFVTGSLFGLGRALADSVRGRAELGAAAAFAAAWCAFVGGVVLGGVTLGSLGLVAALAAVIAVQAGATAAVLLGRL